VKITTAEQAVSLLQSVLDAINQITVKGKENCYRIAASANDLEAVKKFLSKEREENQHESSQP
jgi:hypothetical protein